MSVFTLPSTLRIAIVFTLLYLLNNIVMYDKRIPKCSGCGIQHTQHEFGEVGPHCTGPEKEQPASKLLFDSAKKLEAAVRKRPLPEQNESKAGNLNEFEDEDRKITLLQERLEGFSLHEQRFHEQIIINGA